MPTAEVAQFSRFLHGVSDLQCDIDASLDDLFTETSSVEAELFSTILSAEVRNHEGGSSNSSSTFSSSSKPTGADPYSLFFSSNVQKKTNFRPSSADIHGRKGAGGGADGPANTSACPVEEAIPPRPGTPRGSRATDSSCSTVQSTAPSLPQSSAAVTNSKVSTLYDSQRYALAKALDPVFDLTEYLRQRLAQLACCQVAVLPLSFPAQCVTMNPTQLYIMHHSELQCLLHQLFHVAGEVGKEFSSGLSDCDSEDDDLIGSNSSSSQMGDAKKELLKQQQLEKKRRHEGLKQMLKDLKAEIFGRLEGLQQMFPTLMCPYLVQALVHIAADFDAERALALLNVAWDLCQQKRVGSNPPPSECDADVHNLRALCYLLLENGLAAASVATDAIEAATALADDPKGWRCSRGSRALVLGLLLRAEGKKLAHLPPGHHHQEDPTSTGGSTTGTGTGGNLSPGDWMDDVRRAVTQSEMAKTFAGVPFARGYSAVNVLHKVLFEYCGSVFLALRTDYEQAEFDFLAAGASQTIPMSPAGRQFLDLRAAPAPASAVAVPMVGMISLQQSLHAFFHSFPKECSPYSPLKSEGDRIPIEVVSVDSMSGKPLQKEVVFPVDVRLLRLASLASKVSPLPTATSDTQPPGSNASSSQRQSSKSASNNSTTEKKKKPYSSTEAPPAEAAKSSSVPARSASSTKKNGTAAIKRQESSGFAPAAPKVSADGTHRDPTTAGANSTGSVSSTSTGTAATTASSSGRSGASVKVPPLLRRLSSLHEMASKHPEPTSGTCSSTTNGQTNSGVKGIPGAPASFPSGVKGNRTSSPRTTNTSTTTSAPVGNTSGKASAGTTSPRTQQPRRTSGSTSASAPVLDSPRRRTDPPQSTPPPSPRLSKTKAEALYARLYRTHTGNTRSEEEPANGECTAGTPTDPGSSTGVSSQQHQTGNVHQETQLKKKANSFRMPQKKDGTTTAGRVPLRAKSVVYSTRGTTLCAADSNGEEAQKTSAVAQTMLAEGQIAPKDCYITALAAIVLTAAAYHTRPRRQKAETERAKKAKQVQRQLLREQSVTRLHPTPSSYSLQSSSQEMKVRFVPKPPRPSSAIPRRSSLSPQFDPTAGAGQGQGKSTLASTNTDDSRKRFGGTTRAGVGVGTRSSSSPAAKRPSSAPTRRPGGNATVGQSTVVGVGNGISGPKTDAGKKGKDSTEDLFAALHRIGLPPRAAEGQATSSDAWASTTDTKEKIGSDDCGESMRTVGKGMDGAGSPSRPPPMVDEDDHLFLPDDLDVGEDDDEIDAAFVSFQTPITGRSNNTAAGRKPRMAYA